MKKITKEELANTSTHFMGIVFALSIAWILLQRSFSSSWILIFSMSVFSTGMFVLYASSTIYHWVRPGKAKRVCRYFDHISIYVLIAASYTPIMLCVVGGVLGWIMFGVLWGIVFIGGFFKIRYLGQYPKLSLAVYLLMGWSVLFVFKPVWSALSVTALLYILLEGVFYTTGSYFFAHDEKPYYHAIWHVFVLAGTVSHFFALLQMV